MRMGRVSGWPPLRVGCTYTEVQELPILKQAETGSDDGRRVAQHPCRSVELLARTEVRTRHLVAEALRTPVWRGLANQNTQRGPVDFRVLIHRRVRNAPPPLPATLHPILPWALFPSDQQPRKQSSKSSGK
jgi:hypothetical protein